MRTTEQTIRNPSGLHARPAAMFVRAAAGFGSKVTLENLDRDGATPIDAKSIIAVMSSGVSKGHRVRLTADGSNLEWIERTSTGEIRHDTEPGSTWGTRRAVELLSILPIDWLL